MRTPPIASVRSDCGPTRNGPEMVNVTGVTVNSWLDRCHRSTGAEELTSFHLAMGPGTPAATSPADPTPEARGNRRGP